jgi:hypothetical protein
MYWFRKNLRLSSCLAFAALAIQITASLLHAHFSGLTQFPDKREIVAQNGQPPAALPNTPAPDRRSNGAADSYCPLCALIQAAGMWLPPTAPALELPGFIGPIGLKRPAQFRLAASTRRFFRARAPPLA